MVQCVAMLFRLIQSKNGYVFFFFAYVGCKFYAQPDTIVSSNRRDYHTMSTFQKDEINVRFYRKKTILVAAFYIV